MKNFSKLKPVFMFQIFDCCGDTSGVAECVRRNSPPLHGNILGQINFYDIFFPIAYP